MILRQCSRCGKPVPVGVKLCEGCSLRADEGHEDDRRRDMRRYNASRDPELRKFYRSKAWRMTSASKLDRDRMCEAGLEGCQRIACEVHHVKSLRTPEGWEKRLEWSNLMSVCTRCHNKLDNKWGRDRRYKPVDNSVVDFREVERNAKPGPRG